jgi:Domain of unknown function (DUF4390)
MPFHLPVTAPSRSSRKPGRRRSLALIAALVALASFAALAPAARADTIPVNAAELRIEEGEVLLNAEFEFSLNPTLEDALQKGIPLYFALDFELTRGRWYWLDEKVAQTALVYRVSYNALTRQYRVASGLLTQPFNSLEEVEHFIGRITSRPVASADALTKGAKYEAAVRLRLDVNQLPKPFQVNALASREWTLASDWYRWSFTP